MINLGKKLTLFLLLFAGGIEFISARNAGTGSGITANKKHVCEVCDKAFTQSGTLAKHIRRQHKNTAYTKPVFCLVVDDENDSDYAEDEEPVPEEQKSRATQAPAPYPVPAPAPAPGAAAYPAVQAMAQAVATALEKVTDTKSAHDFLNDADWMNSLHEHFVDAPIPARHQYQQYALKS